MNEQKRKKALLLNKIKLKKMNVAVNESNL